MNHDQFEQVMLEQAYEESRYHRQFHHFLFGTLITLYTALLGFQVSNSNCFVSISTVNIVSLCVGLYVVIPCVFIYLFWTYHNRIAMLNVLIGSIIKENMDSVHLHESVDNIIVDNFSFKKYIDGVSQRSFFSIGSGHPFFIKTFFLFVFINSLVTFSNIIKEPCSYWLVFVELLYLVFLWYFFKAKKRK